MLRVDWKVGDSGHAAAHNDLASRSNRVVRVTDYGAVGTADDTAVVQAALDDLPAAGGSLYFPLANYAIRQTLTLTNKQGAHLFGASMWGSQLQWGGQLVNVNSAFAVDFSHNLFTDAVGASVRSTF